MISLKKHKLMINKKKRYKKNKRIIKEIKEYECPACHKNKLNISFLRQFTTVKIYCESCKRNCFSRETKNKNTIDYYNDFLDKYNNDITLNYSDLVLDHADADYYYNKD